MTSVRFYRARDGRLRGFSVTGHTGFAPAGQDLVCAGVSALAQTAANALETVARVAPHVAIREGHLYIRLPKGLTRRKRRTADIVLRTARQGLRDIAKAYPEFVKVFDQVPQIIP